MGQEIFAEKKINDYRKESADINLSSNVISPT